MSERSDHEVFQEYLRTRMVGERRYDALEEMRQAGDGYAAITAFVDWLRGHGMEIGMVPILPHARLIPLNDPSEHFAAAFYDIDIDELISDRAEFVQRTIHREGAPDA